MSRCQHCNKLTHSEHLIVEYDLSDGEKVYELRNLENWTCGFEYAHEKDFVPTEYGKLKCGDIWIHFRAKSKVNDV